jgi:protoporphyrinogen oxidase
VEKLFFADANELAPDSHLLYGLARVQGFSAEAVRVLKNLPQLNDVLAFRSHLEGKTGQTRFYPKQGGIGQWVDMLIEKFKTLGGDLYLGVNIDSIQQDAGNISAITLIDGAIGTSETLELDHMTWTVAPFHLLRLADLHSKLPTQSATDLTFLDSWLVHLVVDKAPITDLHYYCNYDPKFSHFRSTLYSNMQGVEKEGEHRVTIEIFTESSNDASVSAQDVLQELIECQVFPNGSQVIYENIDRLPRSFPVPTVAFRQQQQAQTECLQENLKNVELYGKARGDIFFMNDVILDVYHHVNQA